MSDYKYMLNDEAKCPHCDYEETDSWELSGEDGDTKNTECGSCGKTYYYQRRIKVQYSTAKTEAEL